MNNFERVKLTTTIISGGESTPHSRPAAEVSSRAKYPTDRGGGGVNRSPQVEEEVSA